MKGLMEREFIAQLVIILGISLGGWILFVQPKVQKLEQIRTAFAAVSNESDALRGVSIEDLADMLADGQRHVAAIAYLNNLAENTTLLYGMVSDLGARNDVTVQSMSPGTSSTHTEDAGYVATRMDMVLEGRYEAIAAFLASIQELPGFVRPVALTVKPAGDERDALAVANFSCEVVRFNLPPALDDMGAGGP